MSDRRFRDELRDVFESLSEPAHPALSARVREHIAAGSAPPASRVPRFAVAVAAVVAIAVVAGLVYVGRGGVGPGGVPAGRPGPTSAASAAPSPSVAPAPSATPSPAATPTPSPSASAPAGGLPAFSCAGQSGPGAAGTPAGVTAVRAGAQAGFDRFVIELNGPPGSYTVTPQATATFVQDASGQEVTLAGSAGLRVVLHGAQAHGTYTGPSDLRPAGTATIREARSTGDLEGVVSWGLGLSKPACFRAFTLSGPSRLVVDVQS